MGQISASEEVLEYLSDTDLVVYDSRTRATHLLESPTSVVYQIIRKKAPIAEELIEESCHTAGIDIDEEELESVLDSLSKINLIRRAT